MKTGKLALIVEDDSGWQDILRDRLEEHGYEIRIAESETQALIIIQQCDVALVTLDISLSQNDPTALEGLRVLSALATLRPNARVIVVSAAQPESGKLAAYETTIIAIVDKLDFKPDNFQTLLERFEHLSPPPVGKALVVENGADWKQLFRELLEERVGLETRCVGSYSAALAELNQHRFDVITIDYRLDSSVENNLYGRKLLRKAKELGIHTFVISAFLKPRQIDLDYKEFGVDLILDKAGFDHEYFVNFVQEMLDRSPQPHGTKLDADLMYRVVQTLLQHYGERNQDIKSSKGASLHDLSVALDKPINAFLAHLRDTMDDVLLRMAGEIEIKEMSRINVDKQAFPDNGNFTTALVDAIDGPSHMPATERWWSLANKSENMKQMVVLWALYVCSTATAKKELKSKLADKLGAVERLRKDGVTEVVTRLLKRWPKY